MWLLDVLTEKVRRVIQTINRFGNAEWRALIVVDSTHGVWDSSSGRFRNLPKVDAEAAGVMYVLKNVSIHPWIEDWVGASIPC